MRGHRHDSVEERTTGPAARRRREPRGFARRGSTVCAAVALAAVAGVIATGGAAYGTVRAHDQAARVPRTPGVVAHVGARTTPYGAGASFCAPWGGLSTSGKSINDVYPCSNRNTADRWGTYQCADFTNRYEYATFGLVAAVDGGDIVRTLHAKDGVPIGSPGKGSLPAPGDAISLWGNQGQDAPGHTGVVDAVSVNSSGNGTIQYLDQNGSLSSNGRDIGYDTIYVSNWVFSTHWNFPYDYNLFDWTEQAGGVVADGSFVSYEGNVYRVVGGAPLYVSSWSVFGGHQPTKALTAAQFGLLRPYPANGTFVDFASGPSKGAGFVFAGGAPLPVANWKNVGLTSLAQLTSIDPEDVANAGGTGVWSHVLAYPANGTPVFIDNPGAGHGSGFVFAGGAPLPVQSWTNVGVTKGSQLTGVDSYALDNPSPTDHVRQYPANGTAVAYSSGPSKGAGFVFAGGAPLAVAKWSNVGVTGGVTGVDPIALNNYAATGSFSHVRQYPANGTAVWVGTPGSELNDGFVFAGGSPLAVAAWSNVGSPTSLTRIDSVAINNFAATGSFSHVLAHPANGTAVWVGTPGSQLNDGFVFAGGAPLYVAAWANVGSPSYTEIDAAAIDNHATTGPYRFALATPANGTFLETKAGADYRVAGGYAFPIADCADVGGCTSPTLVDAWAIENTGVSGRSYLSSVPANGTVVEGEPSGDYWKFEAGDRTSTSATTGAVEVDDTSLSGFSVG